MFNRYYQDELAYLRELGQEFAKAHPAIAPMLAGPGSDPDVERLLEGVAFLTAKLRLKLDDELPEILHSLMEILWPHYLRPVPSITTIQFYPSSQLKDVLAVPKGTLLDSVTVDGTTCRFTTCGPVNLVPLKVEDVKFEDRSSTRSRLVISLSSEAMPLSQLSEDLECLPFFLHGDFAMMSSLYLLMCRHLKVLYLEDVDTGNFIHLDPRHHLIPLALSDGFSLLPESPYSFEGYRLLIEYFLYPSRFLYVGLKGLQALEGISAGFVKLHMVFDRDYSYAAQIGPEHLRLNTVEAVNLFHHEADPIRVDKKKVEYLVRPTGQDPRHYAVYGVKDVVGWKPGTVEKKVFHPIFSFKWSESKQKDTYYQTVVKPAVSWDGIETYISFVDQDHHLVSPDVQTVALNLLCTNANLASRLQVGDVRIPTSDSPELTSFENITKPTFAIWPPLEKRVLWRLISHLSLNYLSLSQPEHLRRLLSLYNFHTFGDQQAARANELKIQGVQEVNTRAARVLYKGQPLSGIEIGLQVSGQNFAGEGDLFLFGQILEQFFSLYCHINTFSRLILTETEKGEEYRWPPRLGKKPLI